MNATKRTRKNTQPQFENRIRFNWGYHDAAQAVQEGWDNTEKNFGFAVGGPLAGLSSPEEVIRRHFDPPYAQGWIAGYNDAKKGTYTRNSETAWVHALSQGKVSE